MVKAVWQNMNVAYGKLVKSHPEDKETSASVSVS